MILRQKPAFRKLPYLALTLLFISPSCSEKQILSKTDLKMAAGDLRTLSLASGRMEEQFAQGNLTRIFYRNQSELLLEKVDDTANQLSATSELEEVHQRISDIAARLKGMLEKAQLGDTVEARELNELGLEAKNIEDSLKER